MKNKDNTGIMSADIQHLLDSAVLSAGFSRVLKHGGNKISAYNNLLEDEWNGRQSALKFLQDGNNILDSILSLNKMLFDNSSSSFFLELVPLKPVLEGVASKFSKCMLDTDISMPGENALVLTDVFLLQDILLETAEIITGKQSDGDICINCFRKELSINDISMFHIDVEAGKFLVITMSQHVNQEIYLDEYVPLSGNIFDCSQENAMSCLRCLGMAAIHKGDVLVNKNGVENGIIILLPQAFETEDTHLNAKIKNGRPETILVVDDEDMIWEVVIDMLQELGYDVLLAGDGKEAVEICEQNSDNIDMVILDMLMPVMNAHEAFPLIQKVAPNVKILLASGYIDESDVQDLLAAGAMGFMRKPYKLKDLARKVRNILDRDKL